MRLKRFQDILYKPGKREPRLFSGYALDAGKIKQVVDQKLHFSDGIAYVPEVFVSVFQEDVPEIFSQGANKTIDSDDGALEIMGDPINKGIKLFVLGSDLGKHFFVFS